MANTTLPTDLNSALEHYSKFYWELRKKLIITLVTFIVSTIAGFFLYEKIIKFLIEILSLKGINIVFTSPFQFINLAFSTGIACGVVITFPLIVFQVLLFLKPALKIKEFKMVVKLLPAATILFLLGLAFGFIIMKWQIKIFLDRSEALGIGNVLDISHLLNTVLITSVLMGIGFEFPILLVLLLKLKIVGHKQLTKIRLWVYLFSFIFAIVLPPDSILADLILSIPLVVLYELTLLFSRVQR